MSIKKLGRKFGNIAADHLQLEGVAETLDNPVLSFTFGELFEFIPEEYHDEVGEIVEILEDRKITEEEWHRLIGLVFRNVKDAIVKPSITSSTVGGGGQGGDPDEGK